MRSCVRVWKFLDAILTCMQHVQMVSCIISLPIEALQAALESLKIASEPVRAAERKLAPKAKCKAKGKARAAASAK